MQVGLSYNFEENVVVVLLFRGDISRQTNKKFSEIGNYFNLAL